MAQPELLTEAVLRRLGAPRGLWIVLWSLVALVSPLVHASAIAASGQPALGTHEFVELITTQAVLAYVTLALLAGGLLLSRRTRELLPEIEWLISGQASISLFSRIGSRAGPVALTVAVALLVVAGGWSRFGPIAPLASLPLLLIYLAPIMTFVWAYLVILVDLHRLGRFPLALRGFPEDRSLGLGELGSLASTGLGVLLVAAIPILVAGSDEPLTFAIGLVIVGVTVGAFVLSMWRLHGQMVGAKARHTALARRLYAEAFAPIASNPSAPILERQATALRAAQSLDERAQSLLTWPIDEGATRFLAVIITSVITSVIVRALFAAVGF